MQLIHLNKDMAAQVSEEDYPELSQFKWSVHSCGKGKLYACRYVLIRPGRTGRVYMHRQITQCPPKLLADHHDGDGLNNQRWNLRVATSKNNAHNTPPRGEGSEYKGVDKKVIKSGVRYRARIVCPETGERLNLGTFKTEIEAAQAYDKKALELFGTFAWLNFPIYSPKPEQQEIPFT